MNPQAEIIEYADDIYIIGQFQKVEAATQQIKDELNLCGLTLNAKKSKLWPALTDQQLLLCPLLQTFEQGGDILEFHF